MFKIIARSIFFFVFVPGLLRSSLWAEPLPPDLMIESQNRFISTDGNGVRRLFFTTWSMNVGLGPVELRVVGTHDGFQDVDQRIYNSDGSSSDREAGTFVYHPSHGHIHFEEFADYRLREVTENDGVGEVVAASEKVSFCLTDTLKIDPPPPGTPANRQYGGALYPPCGDIQGISLGWIDVYDYTLDGQSIVINGVSAGSYWLEMVVDSGNRLLEVNETNNSSRVKINVPGGYSPEIDILGNAQSIPNNDTTPGSGDHTDFGYVDVAGGTTTRTFTIRNTGTGTLSLTGASKVQIIGSGDFAVSTQPSSPVAINGGTVTFQITFDPSALGVQNATVSIVNNDGNESPFQFAIRGNTDLDNDGLPDGWETLYNVSDPNLDDDGDGFSNRDEFIAGTDPRDAMSALKIKEITCGQNGCEIVFDSISGRVYRVEYRDHFSINWTLLEEKTGTGSPIPVNDAAAPEEPERFYRLTVGF